MNRLGKKSENHMVVEGIAFFLCSNRHQSAAVVCFVVQI